MRDIKILNGEVFLGMLSSGAHNLTNKHLEINALNVFPVPDGDTGTNMNLTFTSGVMDAHKVMNTHIGQVAKALSRGLLMGARGNSGVILSQIFRGVSQSIESKNEISVAELAAAFLNGRDVAYKAVMRPVEGTILTVLRESAQATYDYTLLNPEITVLEYFEYLVKEANVSLENTPNLLPVLKEVGVVDSGGKGYLTILEGFVSYLQGNPIELQDLDGGGHVAASDFDHDEFGYCTEFIIRLDANDHEKNPYDELEFKHQLEAIGNSLVVVTDDDLVKVHVHTLTPGNALNLGQQFGEFVKLKIENMTEQHNTILNDDVEQPTKKHSKYALVSVAAGSGIEKMFKDLRVDVVISGGQTMNPSTEDFVESINKLSADHIIILPNNSNIIMAAKQVQSILEDKDIHVIETKSIPQGLSACIMFNPDVDIDENLEEMLEAVKNTKTGTLTYAIKDTSFDSIDIKENDFIGILEKDICAAGTDRYEVVKTLCEKLINEDSELVTLIISDDVSKEEANNLIAYCEEQYDVEVELYEGHQPVYSYIIGVE